MSYPARCWFRLDRWHSLLAIEQKLHTLEQRFPNFINRVGAYCFLVALIASVDALRGERDRVGTLRDEALSIMIAASGPQCSGGANISRPHRLWAQDVGG